LARRGFIFHSCGDATLTVIHEDSPDKYTKVEDVKTVRGARTMALDTKTHNVYLAFAEYGAPQTPAGGRRARPSIVPGSFGLLEFGR
jgi:hypothetical protein